MCTLAISRGSQNKIQVHVNTPLHTSFKWRFITHPRESRRHILQSGQQNCKAHLIAQHTLEHLPLRLNSAVDTYCTYVSLSLSINDRTSVMMVVYDACHPICGIIDLFSAGLRNKRFGNLLIKFRSKYTLILKLETTLCWTAMSLYYCCSGQGTQEPNLFYFGLFVFDKQVLTLYKNWRQITTHICLHLKHSYFIYKDTFRQICISVIFLYGRYICLCLLHYSAKQQKQKLAHQVSPWMKVWAYNLIFFSFIQVLSAHWDGFTCSLAS